MKKLILVLLLSVSLLPAAKAENQLWICPGPASKGILELFTNVNQWKILRASMGTYKFYAGHILSNDPKDCPICGPTVYPALTQRDAFRKLKSWGLKTAVEVGAIKPGACDGTITIQQAREILYKVKMAGGTVDYFDIDNPSHSGDAECGMSDYEIADVMKKYTHEVYEYHRELFPDDPPIKFALIDNYIHFGANHLMQLTDYMMGRGAYIHAIHPDLDYNALKGHKISDARLRADLLKIKTHAVANGLEFGILFFGVDGTTPRSFYNTATAWAKKYKRLMRVRPEHIIVQSWDFKKVNDEYVSNPDVLPETTRYTHSFLANDILKIFK